MENQIKYVRVSADNEESCKAFKSLMVPYMKELDTDSENPLPMELLPQWIDGIIAMQGPPDRHTELCFVDGELIGFLYGKVDHEDHKGFIKPGCGYIMEFYVRPEHRRRGYGRRMFLHMERLFRENGAKRMYLTADPVTGKPFWEALGFVNTGERSPDNGLEIYEKAILRPDLAAGELRPLTGKTAAEISAWQYGAPYEAYSFRGAEDDWLMEEALWGTELFCLCDGERLLGQVACQEEGDALWVGWSMAPELCGRGFGAAFVSRCVSELRRVRAHTGRMLLRVSARNGRAIRAYEQAGFRHVETVRDEIAGSGDTEDFWVMVL